MNHRTKKQLALECPVILTQVAFCFNPMKLVTETHRFHWFGMYTPVFHQHGICSQYWYLDQNSEYGKECSDVYRSCY